MDALTISMVVKVKIQEYKLSVDEEKYSQAIFCVGRQAVDQPVDDVERQATSIPAVEPQCTKVDISTEETPVETSSTQVLENPSVEAILTTNADPDPIQSEVSILSFEQLLGTQTYPLIHY